MDDWGKIYSIYFRGDVDPAVLQAKLKLNEALMLSRKTFIDVQRFRQLKDWERNTAWTAGVALGLHSACVSGASACVLWGIATGLLPEKIEVTLQGSSKPKSPLNRKRQIKYTTRYLASEDVECHHGMRVVSIPHALSRLAHDYGETIAIIAIDSALNRFPDLTKEYLLAWADKQPGFHGKMKFIRAIEKADGRSESRLETLARLIALDMPEVHTVEPQKEVAQFRVDLMINGFLAVEADGEVKYRDNPQQAIRDERRREKMIQNLGHEVLRVGLADLTGANPHLAYLIREALARRGQKYA